MTYKNRSCQWGKKSMSLLIKCIIKNIKVNKPECKYDMIVML